MIDLLTVVDSEVAKKYKETAIDIVRLHFPYLSDDELERSVNYSISKRFKDTKASINNNYKKRTVNGTLMEFTNYILSKEPIITSYGVIFSKHGTIPNPIYTMIDEFINSRTELKNEMFKYPKGSEMYQKYSLLQLLAKLDANALYGALGKFSCIYYNIYVAATTTTQGRSCNSAAALFFESFLNNNVPFGSLNELITFIHVVKKQTIKRKFNDKDILDRNITIQECFFKLMSSCGFGWIPSDTEMRLVWDILNKLDQITINRLFYKNNLFHFVDNKEISNTVTYILSKLDTPFMNPNKVPDSIKNEMDILYDIIYEFVYYDQQIIDRLEKMESLIRSVSIIQDTDSAIVSFDAWYRYIREKTLYVPMKIKGITTSVLSFDDDEVEYETVKSTYTDYDFLNDEIIEVEKELMVDKIIPQEGYRISIINILANIVGRLILDYMYKYTINSNSASNNRECLIIMKNEYLFRRLLQIMNAKKNYASDMELQEGNIIPDNERLDIKGIPCFVKSSTNETIRNRLKNILYNDILNTENGEIDQVKILKDLAIVEKEIYNSIQRGDKEFYKPVKIRSLNGYEDPMRIQGIKSSVVYNAIRTSEMEPIDLEVRNTIDVIKVEINNKNVDIIKDEYPEAHFNIVNLLNTDDFKNGIDAMALPSNENVPKWIIPFVKIHEIINDNISLFPIEEVGIHRGSKTNNYTNIVSF